MTMHLMFIPQIKRHLRINLFNLKVNLIRIKLYCWQDAIGTVRDAGMIQNAAVMHARVVHAVRNPETPVELTATAVQDRHAPMAFVLNRSRKTDLSVFA